MRKITFTLLSMFFVLPCMANIHINPDAVTEVVAKHFPNKQVECIREYNTQLKASNGSGIAASKLWNVCAAGGLDVKQPADKEKCRTFVNELARKGTVKFYEVCGKDKNMVEKGTGRCIDDVFSNKVLGGVKVNMLIATGLSKEYARVKYNDSSLMCSKTARQTTILPDDYVRCASLNKNMTYEFRFDSVTSTTDYVIDEGTESGICKIYGVKYTPFGSKQATYLGNGQKVGDYESWPAACETTDAAKCSKINETMQKFGRTAKIGSTGSKGNKRNACIINKDAISPSNLRTAFGIDNYVFKKGGVQLNATTAVKDQVCAYVRQAVKSPTITSCICNDGFVHIYDFSGMITETDDVLTCKINNKTVDFVFDDLTEHNKKIAAGGSQGMDCMAAGGVYAGQQCMHLDDKQCKLLAEANLKNCPTCKKVEYKNGVCQLPSGADAIQVQKNTRLAIIVGGAVVGVVVTVATAGTAGAPVTAVVFTLVETTGAVIEYNAQVKIDGIADEFLLTSIKCKSASCAEKLIKEHLQRMSNIANDMQPAERNAVDHELARLVKMLPATSQVLTDIVGGESLTEANHKSLLDSESWEPEQVWRAVGVALQMASIFGSVGKWVLTKAGVLSKTLPETTIQLTSKAKMSRVEIQKALSQGKVVKTSNGIEIPKGKLAAAHYDAYGNVIVTAKSKYKQANQLDDVFSKYIHKGLNVDIDANGKFIYHITENTNSAFVEEVLRMNGFRYTKSGDTFLIHEDDIAKVPELVFDEAKFADKMIFAKAAKTDEDIYLAGADLVESFKNNIFIEDLYKVATRKRSKILNIVANDRDLSRIARNFNTASKAEKQKLAQGIVDRLEISGMKVHVLDAYSAAGESVGKDMYIGLNHAVNDDLNGFIRTVAHEHNHAIDEFARSEGALARLPAELIDYQVYSIDGYQNVLGLSEAKSKDLYINALTEQASYYIGDFVGKDFEADLLRMIR